MCSQDKGCRSVVSIPVGSCEQLLGHMIRMQFASAPGQLPENHLFRDGKRLGLSAAFLSLWKRQQFLLPPQAFLSWLQFLSLYFKMLPLWHTEVHLSE